MLEEGQRCTMCGTAPWEWDPEQGGDRHAYEPVVHIDPGCALRDSAAEDTPKQHGHTVMLAPTRGSVAYFRLKKAAETWERGDEE